jgi:8-hydroxy-5-deazaflavin:NADPH oxidoreductase
MKIAVLGRGHVGGGLGAMWERAGHEVTYIGREGGDLSNAEAILVAVLGPDVPDALDGVQGIEGKTVIDATNLVGVAPPSGFASNAEYVKSRTGGPTAKSFNVNFMAVLDKIGETRVRPGNLWCGDEEAREVVQQLNRDAGFDPIYAGPLEQAASQEATARLCLGVANGGMGPFFYRMAPPAQL